jgi:hypothetical protein
VLQTDARADVDQREVVVQDFGSKRLDDDEPTGER